MATSANVQVNANTQQAVGAFNNLAAAIAGASQNTNTLNVSFSGSAQAATAFAQALAGTNTQLGRLNLNIQSTTANANRMNGSHQAMLSVFDQLSNVLGHLFSVLGTVASGVEMVFDSLVHEMDKVQGFNAMMLVTTKSASDAAQTYDFLRSTADRLGVQFDAVSQNYAKLVAALPDGTNKMRTAESVFLGIAEAARTLHASNQDTQLMFYAVTQMAAKGVVSMEELRRQLAEKLPGALQIAARAVHATEAELVAAISKGSVDSAKFLQFFGDELQRTFHDSSEKASTSVSASINRLTNVWVDFVKNVIDSGAGQSIINVFDALREKLSDPYVISAFSALIKELGDKVTDMIKGLTSEDIHKGFDTFAKAVTLVADAIAGLVKGITWLIDHAPATGAALGTVAGAVVGARLAGPIGGVVGAAVGLAGGYGLGKNVEDSGDKTSIDDTKVKADAAMKALIDQTNASRAFEAAATQFANVVSTASPTVAAEISKYINTQKLTTESYKALNTILTSDLYKTEAQKLGAVQDLESFGTLMNPRATGIKDVLNGKQKPSAQERSENATWNKSQGYEADFDTQLQNLNNLMHEGRLSAGQFDDALAKLFEKQPFYIELMKQQKKALEEYNKGLEQSIDQALKQVAVKEEIKQRQADELEQSKMSTDEVKAYTEAVRDRNSLEKVGVTISEEEFQIMKAKYEARNLEIAQNRLENSILDQTIGKYDKQAKELAAMEKLKKDPKTGFTQKDETGLVVNHDQNMKGSDDWLDAQKKQLEDYYTWVDTLRQKDVISEQTAAQAKMLAEEQYNSLKLAATDQVFKDLATLSDSKNKTLSRIGKAAAIADATIQGYLAVQRAIAAPPGWPYNAAGVIAAGVMTGATIAKISSAQGYMSGGYTGDDYATNEVAGVVHGQEFVVNASATAKNRAVLEQMNKGQAVSSGSGFSSGGKLAGLQIEVKNLGTPQTYTAEQVSDTKIRMIAQDVADAAVKKGAAKVAADDMRNPNGVMAKSMKQNTLTSRRRKL